MDISHLIRLSSYCFMLEKHGAMRVPGFLFGDERLISDMDEKVVEQLMNVASLPGIVKGAYAMPDAHSGYGFPIGGVAGFDRDEGVISAGGVGFDISCGVRTMTTAMTTEEFLPYKEKIAKALFHTIPAGVGSCGHLSLTGKEMDKMLADGASWAVANGYGKKEDLERIEHRGTIAGASPKYVSEHAKTRQQHQMGTLGSGNHYLEIQEVQEIYDEKAAQLYRLKKGEIVISIHSGSRGLGHQIATEYSKKMVVAAKESNILLKDLQLACAPIDSPTGRAYLGAMRAASNCALANRQILTHLTRRAFHALFPDITLDLLYDVSHNSCLEEEHVIDGQKRSLFVHRKGATRALGPHHDELCDAFKEIGQPVLIGGSMGTSSYILSGAAQNPALFSTCHGAGRQMSRTQAAKTWRGKEVVKDLGKQGVTICCRSERGISEEAPQAYKDVARVVDTTESAHLSTKVARLSPLLCIKG